MVGTERERADDGNSRGRGRLVDAVVDRQCLPGSAQRVGACERGEAQGPNTGRAGKGDRTTRGARTTEDRVRAGNPCAIVPAVPPQVGPEPDTAAVGLTSSCAVGIPGHSVVIGSPPGVKRVVGRCGHGGDVADQSAARCRRVPTVESVTRSAHRRQGAVGRAIGHRLAYRTGRLAAVAVEAHRVAVGRPLREESCVGGKREGGASHIVGAAAVGGGVPAGEGIAGSGKAAGVARHHHRVANVVVGGIHRHTAGGVAIAVVCHAVASRKDVDGQDFFVSRALDVSHPHPDAARRTIEIIQYGFGPQDRGLSLVRMGNDFKRRIVGAAGSGHQREAVDFGGIHIGGIEVTHHRAGSESYNQYDFLSASLIYQKKDSKLEYKLSGTNLLNTTSINDDSFSQFSTRTSQYTVQPRYLIFSLKYNI